MDKQAIAMDAIDKPDNINDEILVMMLMMIDAVIPVLRAKRIL